MDKKEFEKKLAEKRAKAGEETEVIKSITSNELVKEDKEPVKLKIITSNDVLGITKRSTDRPNTIITTANYKELRTRYLEKMEEKKNAKD